MNELDHLKINEKPLINSVFLSFLYNTINIAYPIIVAPYITRVLGADNLGKVNFAGSLVNWFLIFAVFGTSTYGVREVSKVKNNYESLSIIFSEIVVINGITSLTSSFLYLVFIILNDRLKPDLSLHIIMSVSLFLNVFSIDWLFQGLEEFKYITIRNFIVKIISLILIFCFVNRAEHYLIFGMMNVAAIVITSVMNFNHAKRIIKIKFTGIHPLKHIKKLYVFFLHAFVVGIYSSFDQVMLGFITGTKSVAFMSTIKQFINVSIIITSSISSATLSRASYYTINNKARFEQLIERLPKYILWFSIPTFVGCFILSDSIMFLLGGTEFLSASRVLSIISINILLIPLSTFFQYQILVSNGREKIGLKIAIVTSILSLSLNIILIPKIGLLGASIVNIISELIAVFLRYCYIQIKILSLNKILLNKSIASYILAAFVMSIVITLLKYYILGLSLQFFISVIFGFIVYLLSLIIMKEEITASFIHFINNKINSRN